MKLHGSVAGLWVEVLAEADRKEVDQARRLFPQLVTQDNEVRRAADAEALTQDSLRELENVRVEYGLPAQCPA